MDAKEQAEFMDSLKNLPLHEIEALTANLYTMLMAKINAGTATQEEIRAVNLARKHFKGRK